MRFAVFGLVFIGVLALFLHVAIILLYPLHYKNEILFASKLYDVDAVLIASIINAESSFDANAVSNKGAVGLMQIMPSTAEWIAGKIGIEFTPEILKHPKTNILIGTFYIRYLLDKFGDIKTALMAYNAGQGKVQQWLDMNNATRLTTTPYPETNRYVEKVLNGKRWYRHRI